MASNERPALLTIPAELRNIIYEEVAQAQKQVLVNIDYDSDNQLDGIVAAAPLTRVCRQLRNEAGPVFKAIAPTMTSEYHLRLEAFDFEKVTQLADQLKEGGYLGKDVNVEADQLQNSPLHLHFALGIRAVVSASHLLRVIEDCIEKTYYDPEACSDWPLRFVKDFGDRGIKISFELEFPAKGMSAHVESQTVSCRQIDALMVWLDELKAALLRVRSGCCTRPRIMVEDCRSAFVDAYEAHKDSAKDSAGEKLAKKRS